MSYRALKSARSFFFCRGRQPKKEREGKEREGKERHKKSRKRYISPICGEAPWIFTKFCTSWDMPDIIICANFDVEKLRSLGYTGGSNFGVSHWNGWSALEQCCTTAQPVTERLIGQKSQILPTPFHLAPSFGGNSLRTYEKALRFLKLESSRQIKVKIW